MADKGYEGFPLSDGHAGPSAADDVRAHAQQLIATASELISLARGLEQRPVPARTAAAAPEPFATVNSDAPDRDRCLAMARNIYRERRLRSQIFGDSDLFGEPAWDMLLDLYIASGEGKRVPVTSACIGAAVPTTTALRWLTMLEDRGLLIREHDTHDARRIFVRLTSEAEAKLIDFFTRTAPGKQTASAPAKPVRAEADPAAYLLEK